MRRIRVIWTLELHFKFLLVDEKLGMIDKSLMYVIFWMAVSCTMVSIMWMNCATTLRSSHFVQLLTA